MTKKPEQSWNLPPGLERLWDEQQAGSRRAGLNLPEIVSTAVEMADANGIDDVTMARLARRLGFSTMALYRHVPNKSALVALMVDAAVGGPPAGFRDLAGWRAQLEVLARAISGRYRAHPWLLDVPISGPPATPNNMRWMEAGLVALRETPLDDGGKIRVWVLVAGFVRGQEQIFLDLGRGAQAVRELYTGANSYADVLRRFAGRGHFPELLRAIDAHVFDDVSTSEAENDAEFEFGLRCVLDGLRDFIEDPSPDP